MVTLNDDRSAALLIRVWVEEGAGSVRSRVSSIDTSGGEDTGEITVAVTESTDDVLQAVRRWLDDFSRRASDAIDTD